MFGINWDEIPIWVRVALGAWLAYLLVPLGFVVWGLLSGSIVAGLIFGVLLVVPAWLARPLAFDGPRRHWDRATDPEVATRADANLAKEQAGLLTAEALQTVLETNNRAHDRALARISDELAALSANTARANAEATHAPTRAQAELEQLQEQLTQERERTSLLQAEVTTANANAAQADGRAQAELEQLQEQLTQEKKRTELLESEVTTAKADAAKATERAQAEVVRLEGVAQQEGQKAERLQAQVLDLVARAETAKVNAEQAVARAKAETDRANETLKQEEQKTKALEQDVRRVTLLNNQLQAKANPSNPTPGKGKAKP